MTAAPVPNVPNHYRADIDGLRAVAVLSVLAFHAFPSALTGGFVGVDVFFVISGFLITGILLEEVAEQRFSVLRFYIRRARRLFPALITVMVVTALAGWALMFPWEFQLLGKHLLAGSTFVSNLTLWSELGYFDPGSETKPLLHLWSLAVEEQYYLLWPLLVWLLARRDTRRLALSALALGAVSAAACAALGAPNPSLDFYMPFTRFWELLAGAGVAIWARMRSPDFLANAGHAGTRPNLAANALSVAGLLAIGWACVMFDQRTVFPGVAAMVPVAGAMLLIAAGSGALVNRALLSWRPMVWVGLISYPLYLWHWPLLSFARIVLEGADTTAVRAGLMIIAVLLAWATYACIERPLRAPRGPQGAGKQAAALWLVVGVIGLMGLAAWKDQLRPYSASAPAVVQAGEAREDKGGLTDRGWRGDQPGTVLFIGDSHMQHYQPRIEQLFAQDSHRLMSARFETLAGCAPVGGLSRTSVDCGHFTAQAWRMAHDPAVKTVVLAASWLGFAQRPDHFRADDPERHHVDLIEASNQWLFDRWSADLRGLRQAGKRVVVILSSPRGPEIDPAHRIDRTDPAWPVAGATSVDRAAQAARVARIDDRVRRAAELAGAEVLDPKNYLCDASRCPVVDGEGRPLFIDDSHLRASFVRSHLTFLDDLLQPAPAPAAVIAHAPSPLGSSTP